MSRDHAAALLGIGVDASPDQVNRAWRVWAKLAHPDTGGDRGHFEALAQARVVLLSAAESPGGPTPQPAMPSVPRVPLRSVVRRPGVHVALALALALMAALILVLSTPYLPAAIIALAAGSISGGSAWVLHRSLLTPAADTGHRIGVLTACWFPLAILVAALVAIRGVSIVAFLPIIALPFVLAVALVNPGAGLWRPSRLRM